MNMNGFRNRHFSKICSLGLVIWVSCQSEPIETSIHVEHNESLALPEVEPDVETPNLREKGSDMLQRTPMDLGPKANLDERPVRRSLDSRSRMLAEISAPNPKSIDDIVCPSETMLCSGKYSPGKTKFLYCCFTNHVNDKHGLWVWLYPNGTKRSQGEYKNNQINGSSWSWYPDGRLSAYSEYDDGERQPGAKLWDPEGREISQKVWGGLNGFWKGHSETGISREQAEKVAPSPFKKGDIVCPIGTKIMTYKSQPENHRSVWCSTSNGKQLKNGPSIVFYSNGNIRHLVTYILGNKNGPSWSWYPDGRLGRQREFANNQPLPGAMHWDKEGREIPQEDWGGLNGFWKGDIDQ